VVTGSSGHIGQVVVEAFLAAGARVSALDIRQPNQLPRTPGSVIMYEVDIKDEIAVEETFVGAVGTFGPISTCVAVDSMHAR
jgi:NAD(P)-dependent dehydrogenase (short-subunit alcohol dehydrogenase family)